MLEALSMYSDELMELLLSEEDDPEELIHDIIRAGRASSRTSRPCYLGTAYRNKGVQPLLDAIVALPAHRRWIARSRPRIRTTRTKIIAARRPIRPSRSSAWRSRSSKTRSASSRSRASTRARSRRATCYFNQRTGKKDRFSRIVKMHADKREEIDSAEAGDIVAIMGIDCASGDTYASEPKYCTLENMFVAKPVIKMSIKPLSRDDADRLSKALQRFRKEDPTFQRHHRRRDGRDGDRRHGRAAPGDLRRADSPRVQGRGRGRRRRRSATANRPPKPVAFNFTHKKQTGGSGQYAHIVGQMGPMTDEEAAEAEGELLFVDNVVGGRIPKNFIPAIEKGFRNMLAKGPVAGFPVVGIKIELNDGTYHEVDSSDMAFRSAPENCFRETFPKMKPVLLEPIMMMEIEVPEHFQGTVVGNISARRGIVIVAPTCRTASRRSSPKCRWPRRSATRPTCARMTQGQGTFTMELAKYRPVPANIQTEVIAERKAELQPA